MQLPKFKEGDKVILRQFDEDEYPRFVTKMRAYVDTVQIISQIIEVRSEKEIVYRFKEVEYSWKESAMILFNPIVRIERFKEKLLKIIKYLNSKEDVRKL